MRAAHNPTHFDGFDLRALVDGQEENLDAVFSIFQPVYDFFDAVSDVPTMVLFRQLAVTYPNSRFILLHRDATEWTASVRRLIGSRNFTRFERILYWQYFHNRPHSLSVLTDRELVRMHARHTSSVAKYFRSEQSRLGAFHLNDPLLSEKFCSFMGRKIVTFPRKDFLPQ
jgi:hypothetical protein